MGYKAYDPNRKKKKRKTGLIVCIVVVCVLAAIAGGGRVSVLCISLPVTNFPPAANIFLSRLLDEKFKNDSAFT